MAQRLPTVHINGTTYLIDERRHELRNADNPKDTKRFDDSDDLREYLYWTAELQTLVGQVVTAGDLQYDEYIPGLVPIIHFQNGSFMMLLSDEEGNGPGRFDLLTD